MIILIQNVYKVAITNEILCYGDKIKGEHIFFLNCIYC